MMTMAVMVTFVLFSLSFSPAVFAADASGSLQVHMDETVVYSTAQLKNIEENAFLLPMQNGLAVSVVWNIKVGKVREYWLNKNIAKVSVERRVEPDLLTHSWLLVNVSSGISLRIHDVRLVMDFLTQLRQFPMLDRSLLLADTPYRTSVDVDIQIGKSNNAWWSGLWPSAAASMHKDFTLP